MGFFTRTLVFVVASLFLALGVWAAIQGNTGAALSGFVLFAAVAFIGGVGWFSHRFPMPPLPSDAPSPNMFSEAKRFAIHYPGWPGRFVKYGIPALYVAAVLLSIFGLWIKLQK